MTAARLAANTVPYRTVQEAPPEAHPGLKEKKKKKKKRGGRGRGDRDSRKKAKRTSMQGDKQRREKGG